MKLKPENLYEEYIEDVILRCQNAVNREEQEEEELKSLPIDILIKEFERTILEDEKYRKSKNQSLLNSFKKRIIPRAYCYMFWDTKEIKELFNSRQTKLTQINEDKTLTEKQKQVKRGIIDSYTDIILENMFDKLPREDKEKCIQNYYAHLVSTFRADQDVRKDVQKILEKDGTIDPTLDKGNCTKAIIASLIKLEKKYDIKIFKHLKKDGIENILHPKQLIEYLAPYVKRSETGNIKDIEDIKKGDICILSFGDGPPSHAMMCYDFNSKEEPLLLGYTPNTLNYNGFYQNISQTPHKGIVIDIQSLINDVCKNKVKIKKRVNDNSR